MSGLDKLEEDINSYKPVLEKRRWLILSLFALYSMSNSYQWIQLNIIDTSVINFWKDSLPSDEYKRNLCIEWLSMIYMLTYIPFIIPSSWFLSRYGLYFTSILATGFNTMGAWGKCVSMEVVRPTGQPQGRFGGAAFSLLMVSQTVCAVAQVLLLGVPPQLAATWFGERELASATAIGVFGNQLGVAIGFCIPVLIVPIITPSSGNFLNTTEFFSLKYHFRILLYGSAAVISVIFFLVLFLFAREPRRPPSRAQYAKAMHAAATETEKGNSAPVKSSYQNGPYDQNLPKLAEPSAAFDSSYRASIFRLLKDINFLYLLLVYGINAGVYYAVGTLLPSILTPSFQGQSVAIGWVGFTMIVSGVLGAIIAGVILDKTKKYKLTLLVVHTSSVVCYIGFVGIIYSSSIYLVGVMMFLLGLFQSGFLPLGFEFAAETTYPENEGLSAGLLNLSAQLFGMIFILSASPLINKVSVLAGNLFFAVTLFVGILPTVLIKENLRRQKSQQLIIREIVVAF